MKKMEKEMENVFETKVKEKKQKLKDSEHELTQKHKNVSHPRPCRPGRSETNDRLVRYRGGLHKAAFLIAIRTT